MDVKKIILVFIGLYVASNACQMRAEGLKLFPSFSPISSRCLGENRIATSSALFFVKRTGIVLGVAGAAYVIYCLVRRAYHFQLRQLPFKDLKKAHKEGRLHLFSDENKQEQNKRQEPVQVKAEVMLKQQVGQMKPVSEQEFITALDDVQKVLSNRYGAMAWLEGARPSVAAKGHILITQKIMLPQHADVRFVGDIHGDADALEAFFKNLQEQNILDAEFVLKKDTYYIFLGDYVDRGNNGVKTWCLLSKFLKNNPQRVFLLRGNHEDINVNYEYGFSKELNRRFGHDHFWKNKSLPATYNLLPSALFLGYRKQDGTIGYIVCCHGNLEFGYDPRNLLIDQRDNVCQWVKKLYKKNFYNLDEHMKKMFCWYEGGVNCFKGDAKEDVPGITEMQNQFLWGRQHDKEEVSVSFAGIMYGPSFFKAVVKAWQFSGRFSIDAVIRGHDHLIGTEEAEHGFKRLDAYDFPFYTIISACPVGVRRFYTPKYKFTYLHLAVNNGLALTPIVIQ